MHTPPSHDLPESLASNLGIQLVSAGDGTVKAVMPVDHRTTRASSPADILSGGASLALAETAAGYGSLALCDPDKTPVGIQVSANHVHMVTAGTHVVATGVLIHRGRTTHIWNIDITTPEGQLVSTARVVNHIIDKRS